jgi:hypothetical protein
VLVGVMVTGGGPAIMTGAPVIVTVVGSAVTVRGGDATWGNATTVTVVGAAVTMRPAVALGTTVTVTGGGMTVRAARVIVRFGAVIVAVAFAAVIVGCTVTIWAALGDLSVDGLPVGLATVAADQREDCSPAAASGSAGPELHGFRATRRTTAASAADIRAASHLRLEGRRVGTSASPTSEGSGRTTNGAVSAPASGPSTPTSGPLAGSSGWELAA